MLECSEEELRGWLQNEVARLLEVDPDEVRDEDRFAGLGLDSMRATVLAAALSEKLGERVPPTLLWAHPSIAELVPRLADGPEQITGTGTGTAPRSAGAPDEPIAVVGMACRFPGANGLEEFWELLRSGVDAVRPVPSERWIPDPALAGGRVPAEAGFLEAPVDAFDPLFFGISPREAAEIDPQQRLFLEVAWEALEEGGLAGDGLRGSRTGVFAGAIWHDHADLHGTDVTRLSAHSATGQALNMVANRLSYVLGLRGPSMTLDSACSSSLLAVHLACRSIVADECEMAVAGGVNLLLSETTMVSLAHFGGLAKDGRCKAFDAAGDGFGRGEGCGVVVLKRLSRALADGDRIWCVIKGSAVNNDGPSNGLTAPSPQAQEDVLRQAYARADVSPGDVHYVETHGTGTALGDPIEAAALGAVLGAGRAEEAPLLIGSVKTNLGHLEGSAGIAGLIKAALCLHHGGVPANLHFHVPNPHIDFDALRLRVPTEYVEWPEQPRLAGVSSFGWGGTNVHVVMEAWTEPAPLRAPLPEHPAATTGEAGERRVVFVCSPHGHQWAGMGRLMLRTEPVFRAVVERCDRELARYTHWSVLDELYTDHDRVRYDDVAVTQPVLFTVQVALAAWLESRGVRPDAVVGHSLGEIAAAVIAGFLDIPEAVRLVFQYSRHQRRIAGRGEGMAIVELPETELTALTADSGIVIAARNGPRSTALSGPVPALEGLISDLKSRGVLCSMIKVNVAAHSPAVDEIAADLVADIGELTVSQGRIPMVSTVTAEPLEAASVDAAYFARNLRQEVLLAEATAKLLADGNDVFLELSAHPVLLPALQAGAQEAGDTARVFGTMCRGDDDRAGLWDTLGELARLGAVRPGRGPAGEADATAELFTLSAMTPEALRTSAQQVAAMLDDRTVPMADLATTAIRRSTHPYRLAAVARTSDDLAAALRDHSAGSVRSSRAPARRPKVVFVFPGQGAQWVGMGRELLEREPVFAAAIRDCDAAARAFTDWSILDELYAGADASRLDRIDVVQPTLFALEVALARLWKSWGVRPDAVVGHSMGEAAAAHIAGAVSLEDATRVICLRSGLMRRASGQGAMLAVELTAAEAMETIGSRGDLVSLAVSNSPRSTVLSGDRAVLDVITDELTRREVFCRWVKVDVASHSPQMDDLRDDLLRLLDGVSGQEPRIPMYSTVTGKQCTQDDFDPGYWFRNLRSPVLFGEQVGALMGTGHTVFIEMSPHPILLPAVQQTALELGAKDVEVLPSLRRGEPAREVLLDSLGALYVSGVPVDRSRATTPGRRQVGLPPYPWQRDRYTVDTTKTAETPGRWLSASLLGVRLDSAIEPDTHYWQPTLHPGIASIGDHIVGGRIVVPGSAYLDMVVRAAHEVLSGPPLAGFEVSKLRFRAPLIVDESGRKVQVALRRAEDSAHVRVFTDDRTCVAEATVSPLPTATPGAPFDVSSLERRLSEHGMPGAEYYTALAGLELAYGPAYRRVSSIAASGQEVVARIDAPPSATDRRHLVHPAVLDAALHSAVAPALSGGSGARIVSGGIERVAVHRRLDGGCYAHAVVRPSGSGFRADVTVYGLSGELLLEATGVTLLRTAGTPARSGMGEHSEPRAAGTISTPARGSLAKARNGTRGGTADGTADVVDTADSDGLAAIEHATAECVAAVARMPAAAIDPDTELRAFGIDSLMAMELRNRLEGRFGVVLSATTIWSHPTVRQLALLVVKKADLPLGQ